MDAHRARQLQHLEQLCLGRPVLERAADVEADARLVQVRRGRVDREQNELLHLRLEMAAVAPRRGREADVRREEVGVELEQPLERLVPAADTPRRSAASALARCSRECSESRLRRLLHMVLGGGRGRAPGSPASIASTIARISARASAGRPGWDSDVVRRIAIRARKPPRIAWIGRFRDPSSRTS